MSGSGGNLLLINDHDIISADLLPTYFLTGEMPRTIKSFFICATQDLTSGNGTVAH